MNNFYHYLESKHFIGDCINGLDDDRFCNHIAYDATDMAQLVGGGEEVSLQHFSKECSVEPQVLYQVSNSPSRYHFFINKDRDIAWIYDDEKDIHYFYG